MRKIITLLLIAVTIGASARTSSGNTGTSNNSDSASISVNSISANANSVLLNSSLVIKSIIQSTSPVKAVLAYTRQLRPVDIHYFPGTSNQNALVIGGVHGSELSSVSVAKQLIELLSNSEVKPYYNVIIIPSLFPDNAALADQYK